MGWWWALVVVVLLLGGAAVLARLCWGLVRQALALGRDLADAAARMGEITSAVATLPAAARSEPAIFDDPARLRHERAARIRRAASVRKHARKRARASG